MKDWHVHIGQFRDIFFDYHDVFDALINNEINEITLAYLTPCFDKEKNSLDFYHAVVEELKNVRQYANENRMKVSFLYWADPFVLKNISLKKIFKEFSYAGIALHPLLHNWSFEYKDLLTDIFKFASGNSIPLFIHTGISEKDTPLQFTKWFSDFPEVKVRLAHCKSSEPIIHLFNIYPNLTGDTAFCPEDSYQNICIAGYKNRMYYGTDFPISYWYETFKNEKSECNVKVLTEHYAKVKRINAYQE